MIDGGNASVYVSNMDRAIEFYRDGLGLSLRTRVDDSWAEIDAGSGLTIGLHPARVPDTVAAGTVGAINIELRVTVPLEEVITAMKSRGVQFNGEILEYENVRLASVSDPDQNVILLAQVLHG